VQCGFCTPGFVVSLSDLLRRNPDPDEFELREALSGNLCRCTGYVKIFEAANRAAAELRGAR
jgi:carbon-monoxide dehydrogenase small subunit